MKFMDLTLIKHLDSLINRYWNSDFEEHVSSLRIDIVESENILSFLKRLNNEERYMDLQTIGKSLLMDSTLQFDESANNQLGIRLVKDCVDELKVLFEEGGYPLDYETRQDNIFPIELNLHPKIVAGCKFLFRDKHYSQAIFESVKIIEKEIKLKTNIADKIGVSLATHVFHTDHPLIKIVEGEEIEHKDEREGFRFLFMGTFLGIKNPKSHSLPKLDDSAKALEYLCFLSLLMKKLDESIVIRN